MTGRASRLGSLAIVMALPALAEPLPEARPAEAVITYGYGGGMRGESRQLELSAKGGKYSESLRGDDGPSFTFAVPAADLDALWKVLRENQLDRLETTPELIHDKAGVTITASWKGGSASYGDSGAMVADAWKEQLARICAALDAYEDRVIEAHQVDLLLVAGEGLRERAFSVYLGDRRVMAHGKKDTSSVAMTRAALRLLPGKHWLGVELGPAGQKRLELALDGPRTVRLLVTGDEVRMEEEKGVQLVSIKAADAKAKGLPSASITFDAPGLMATPFPAAGCYVSCSGPPGGPLGLSLEAYQGVANEVGALEKLAAQRFAKRSFVAGQPDALELGGAERVVVTCVSDTSHARSLHLLALFPSADGASDGVLLDFWCSAGSGPPLAPDGVLALEQLGDIVRSVRVRFER